MTLCTHLMDSPVGPLLLAVDEDGALVRLEFAADRDRAEIESDLAAGGTDVRRGRTACAEVERQLREYFRGRRRDFDLPLAPEGTDFQRRVWKAVARIPFGATATYAQVARRVRHPQAVRAVGRCNATNPIPIVVPCHRVVGSDGSLTGYGGGLEAKRTLLELERAG